MPTEASRVPMCGTLPFSAPSIQIAWFEIHIGQQLEAEAAVGSLSPEAILPTMGHWEVAADVAAAVAAKAVDEGLAANRMSHPDFRTNARAAIAQSRMATEVLMRSGAIPVPTA